MADSPHTPGSVVDAFRASHLREVVHQYAQALKDRRKGIDRLNVYPVPDGDTGTNMSLTVQSVVAELKGAATDDMHAVSAAISKGAIMGARGNSGAILAQVLRGLAESVKEKAQISPADLGEALERARNAAYGSVLRPVEGTILTVVTAAAEAAKASAAEGHRLADQVQHVRKAAAEALERTPELLPVLKQAGVVDAGGSGFLLFVDALRSVATGEPIPGATDADLGAEVDEPLTSPNVAEAHSELADLRYEVMFLLDADDAVIPGFREAWAHVGDSIVVVGGDGLWNCHIHTDEIGPAIEAAIECGRPHQIRVTDLQEQAGAEHGDAWHGTGSDGQAEQADGADGEPMVRRGEVATAVVAVVNGAGMSRLYRSLGVQELVVGGQSMNPSVAELLHAVEAAPSRAVVVLPNNKNIHAAANQLDALTNKRVVVVPTRSCVEGMAALLSYDAAEGVEGNGDAMGEAASAVTCGEVTQAVRDTQSDAGPIKEGDWLGIGPDGICVVAKSTTDALCELVDTLSGEDHEILTVIEGEGSTTEATASLRAWVAEHRANLEVEVHHGGQPLYPYLVGVE